MAQQTLEGHDESNGLTVGIAEANFYANAGHEPEVVEYEALRDIRMHKAVLSGRLAAAAAYQTSSYGRLDPSNHIG